MCFPVPSLRFLPSTENHHYLRAQISSKSGYPKNRNMVKASNWRNPTLSILGQCFLNCLKQGLTDASFFIPFPYSSCHQCHCLSTLPPPPHWQLGTSCVGSGEDEDKHHEPTSGHLRALTLGIKHLELQSSSENITNCLSDGLFKEEAYLRLEKMKIHTACIDFIRG